MMQKLPEILQLKRLPVPVDYVGSILEGFWCETEPIPIPEFGSDSVDSICCCSYSEGLNKNVLKSHKYCN